MKGIIMNYFEWSKEYEKAAEELGAVISQLTTRKRKATPSEKLELSDRIAIYKRYRNECLNTANHLMDRHRGVA